MGAAIEARDVAKRYRVGTASPDRSLIDTLGHWAKNLGKSDPGGSREFWALRDVSFKIEHGESVALIGNNGAGKSTLLKILSRVTEPTLGSVLLRGRIGSLLEVGTGFHHQLSGRDNVYLSGAVLGMSGREIGRKFDEIVDFAGIGSFIDEPVKHYSSGMYLRLAFSVAAYLDTDILLLDEVIAVGDVPFQRKCHERIENLAREGRAIIFVSHNLSAVQSLCSRALLLQQGALVADGPTQEVLSSYFADALSSGLNTVTERVWDEPDFDGVQPLRAAARAVDAGRVTTIDNSSSFMIEWEYRLANDHLIDQPCMTLNDINGLLIFDQAAWDEPKPLAAGTHRTRCIVPGRLLNDGIYSISFQFNYRGQQVLELPRALVVEVKDSAEGRFGWYGAWPGVIRPKLDWQTELIG
jgi:lipopolysaccharide transport system ATP-binding protein